MRFGDGVEVTRRDLIAGIGASVVAPQLVAAQADSDLHVVVASQVRALVGTVNKGLTVLCPSGAARNLAPVVTAFTELTGVSVTDRAVPAEAISSVILLETMTGEDSFDVALPATFSMPDLVSSQVIQPLDVYAKKYEPADFREGILYDIGDSFDGSIYGFQADGDAYLMFYLKGLLENPDESARYEATYGQPLSKPQTWAELDRQMEWFHRPEKEMYGGLLLRSPGYLAWEWWGRFHAYGMWPFSPEMDAQINSPEGVAALEDMIRTNAFLHPEAETARFTQNWDRFSQGRTYCNIGWGGAQKFYNKENSPLRGQLAYGPTPGGASVNGREVFAAPYFNWGWNYVVSKSSRQPELAYLFSLFASSPTMSTISVREQDGFFDPIRPEHYLDRGIQAAYSREFLTVHRASLVGAIPDLYLMNQAEYFRVLNEVLTDGLHGVVTPQAALDRAAQLWELITSRIGRANQVKRWQQLRQKYPVNVSKHLRDVSQA